MNKNDLIKKSPQKAGSARSKPQRRWTACSTGSWIHSLLANP